MKIPCKNCANPTYCYSILGECDIAMNEKLEDERQSEAFYESFLEDNKQEELEEQNNFLEEFEED